MVMTHRYARILKSEVSWFKRQSKDKPVYTDTTDRTTFSANAVSRPEDLGEYAASVDGVGTHVEYADLGEALQRLPLLADVVLVSDDDDVLELAVVVVAGA